MRFYFDRTGRYRGYSVGPIGFLAAALVIVVLALAFGYQLFMLAPVIALVALTIWLWHGEIKRIKARRAARQESSSAASTSTR